MPKAQNREFFGAIFFVDQSVQSRHWLHYHIVDTTKPNLEMAKSFEFCNLRKLSVQIGKVTPLVQI